MHRISERYTQLYTYIALRAMDRKYGRKRKLTQEEVQNLNACQRVKGVSGETARKIWNIANELRENPAQASRAAAGRQVIDRLRHFLSVCEWHVLPASENQQEKVLLADIVKLLQIMAQSCPAWAEALERTTHGMDRATVLHPIIYHDEIVCGNILAPLKRKKVIATYVGFREMRTCLHSESAWLPVLLLQHDVIDNITGGLSALCLRLVESIHSRHATSGFQLDLPGGAKAFKIGSASALLSDQDAQRGSFSIKGSSGIVPCLYCANVLAGDHAPGVPGAVPVHEWDCSKFLRIDDESRFRAADDLLRLNRPTDIQFREKATGLNRNPQGLLFHAQARRRLPPSMACVDTLHSVFFGGVASWECGLLAAHFKEQDITLADLKLAATTAQWRRPGHGQLPATSILKALLHEKLFEGNCYKGQGHQTRVLVFLLRYYVDVLLGGRPESDDVARSFHWLHLCCRQLKALSSSWLPLGANDAAPLTVVQSSHQQAFVRAYGAEAVKPKHHHRFHLADAIPVLGILPDCTLHEKKHQTLKSGGLVDNQARNILKSEEIQKSILPRLIESCVDEANNHGLCRWGLLPPVTPAPQNLQDQLGHHNYSMARSMQLLQVTITEQDILIFPEKAFLLERCLCSAAAGFLLKVRELEKISTETWGSRWKDNGLHGVLKPAVNKPFVLPTWWRREGQTLVCLH